MGRQFDIGDSPARRVVQRVKEAVDEDRALDPVEVRELLIKAADESSRSRKKKISQEWVGNNIERLGLATKNGQDKPDARQEAERDLLNGLSTLTGFQLVADVVPDEALVINFDATQFMISGGKGGTLQVVVVKDEPLSGPISTKSKGGNELNFFIKWYSIISATGVPGPLVFMLACDSMGPDEFEVFEVRGLCKSDAAINDFGYIVFCATRSGNASFYKWLNQGPANDSQGYWRSFKRLNHPQFLPDRRAAPIQHAADTEAISSRADGGGPSTDSRRSEANGSEAGPPGPARRR